MDYFHIVVLVILNCQVMKIHFFNIDTLISFPKYTLNGHYFSEKKNNLI